jgi:hypothetical protein
MADHSASYDTDPLVRVIEDYIESVPAHRRLYPDLFAEELAKKIRQIA